MALDKRKVEEAADLLDQLLGPELTEVIRAASAPMNEDHPFYIPMPVANDIDLTAEDLASRVAKTSNTYFRIARLCGMARAELKLAEYRYKTKYKGSMTGSNKEEREANAVKASIDEGKVLSLVESVVEMAEKFESAARIASESARKLFDKVQVMKIAASREEHGLYQETDFKPW